MLPGTTHDLVIPTLEKTSGKKYGTGFGVTVNPEFLREGTAIHDFRQSAADAGRPQLQVRRDADRGALRQVEAPMVNTSIRTAEMIKYASNTWHALKVCFANEIGNLCKRARDRQPRGDGHLLPRREAEPVVVLHEARVSRSAARACRRTCARCSIARRKSTSRCR